MAAAKKKGDRSRAETIERANRVAPLVDVFEIRLISQMARLKEWGENLPSVYGVAHRAEAKRDSEKSRIVVEAAFNFELAHDDLPSKAAPPAAIRAVFSLAYDVKNLESLADEDLQAFADTSGVSNAWPFWRELVYSTMSRMGLPPLTLPTLKLFPDEESPASSPNETATASKQPS
jgi:hypothetical protein